MLYIALTTVPLLCVLGSWRLIAVGIRGRRGVYIGTTLICSVNSILAAIFLLYNWDILEVALPIGLPWVPAHFRLDGLSALFLLLVSIGGMISSVYGINDTQHAHDPTWIEVFFPLFLASMTLVVLADDALFFLLSWEFMSIASWFMVLASHQRNETRQAAAVYISMAALGTEAMMLAFGTLSGSAGDYTFNAIRDSNPSPLATSLVVTFVLVGTGSKAGIIPLHAWLPLAHPAAPSHVSALMSGVMTKISFYALVRVLFDFLPNVDWEWSLVFLTLGSLTAGLGILYAVVQRDIKTLLAYSTVENIGVIFTAVGLALAFKANGYTELAGLSLVAGLLHAFNHSIYKSLLFLGAGTIITTTGHRDLEQLGGLIHRLPVTAATFLVGSMAISSLPPFNGFVSEWLLLQAILSGPSLPEWTLKLAMPVVGAVLVLSAALAASCFVRVFGIAFLGRPRSVEAAVAKEPRLGLLLPLVILASICTVLGIVPAIALIILGPVVKALINVDPLSNERSWTQFLWIEPVEGRDSSYGGLILLATIVIITTLALLVRGIVSKHLRRSHPWDCGYPDQNPFTQYTASSLSQPIRRVFTSFIFTTREVVDMPDPCETSAAHFSLHMQDPIWRWFYRPALSIIGWSADKFNAIQFMAIREYLTVMFSVLIVLLVIMVMIR